MIIVTDCHCTPGEATRPKKEIFPLDNPTKKFFFQIFLFDKCNRYLKKFSAAQS